MRFFRALVLAGLLSASGSADQSIQPELDAALLRVNNDPDSEAARLDLGSQYLRIGQYRAAAETLQQYLAKHPGAGKPLRLLALSRLQQEDYKAAREAAEEALRNTPRDAASVQILAMANLGLQDTKAAERLFREAIQLDPNLADAHFQLGLLYANKGENLPQAIRLLERARALQPGTAGVYTALGAALLKSGDARRAAQSFEIAVKLAPDSTESFYQLSAAYRQLKLPAKADEAMAAFNALSKTRAEERARDMRSRAAYEEGLNLLANSTELDKAYGLFARAVADVPNMDAGYYRMAQVSYLKGDVARALVSIREALRLNPLEAEYHYVLARCLEPSDPAGAEAAVEKAISIRAGVADFEELRSDLRRRRR